MTKTKQCGTFMTNCLPIVEELESSSANPGMLPISSALSVLRGLRRTLQVVTSLEPLTTLKLDRLWKRSALCRNLHVNLDKISCDEVAGAGG